MSEDPKNKDVKTDFIHSSNLNPNRTFNSSIKIFQAYQLRPKAYYKSSQSIE